MKLRRGRLLIALVLLVLVGPVLVAWFAAEEGRQFTGVPLEDLDFTEIAFRNAQQDIDLAALLFVPQGEGPFPVAVIIHGSGTSSRNNAWYSTLVGDLVERGIAVLLPDKRGSEKSGGDWRTSSFEDLATDTLAAVEHLEVLGDPRFSYTGVIGMSQGGWIAPVAASRSDLIRFVVSFSGAAVTPPEQLHFEEVHNLRQSGLLPGISNLVAYGSSAYIRHIAQRAFWNRISGFEPLDYWRQLNTDALLLFGADDTNVPVRSSIERIQSLDNPGLTTVVYEQSGHPIEQPVHQGSRLIRPEAMDAIADYVLGTPGLD